MYDQMMSDTIRGNFGLEYTYGNQFADHAYLITLIFLPIKFLFGNLTPAFLISITPLSAGVTAFF